MKKTPLLAAFAALALAACAAGPNYVRPTAETPAAYKEAQGWKVAQPQDHLPRGAWWQMFGDPVLNALEEQVNAGSQELRVAEARYRQSRALAQAARAAYFPILTGDVAVTRARSPGPQNRAFTNYNARLDASWEPDLWGRVQRSVEAGEAGAQAASADLESVRLTLQAELAQNYLLLRVADAQIRLLNQTVAGYERSLQVLKNQYAVGVVARADVAQAETQLKSAQAQALDQGVQRSRLEHAIAVLIGKPPSSYSLPPVDASPTLPAIPVGLPSELLERRPDIAGAERRVAAANAQVGVAQAAFFPALTLSAAAGFQSTNFAHWLSVPNRFWSLGPALAQTLLDGGVRRARSEQAVAQYDESVAAYRQTVLGGLQEVEDNLAALRILEQEAQVQEDAARAAREAASLTVNQYKAGTLSWLNVVDVEARALGNERAALSVLGQRLTAAVLLIRALGGGWSAGQAS